MYYKVINVTLDRFKYGTKKTYIAISDKEYDKNHEKYHDRIYAGGCTKDYAEKLAKHLNKNNGFIFKYKPKKHGLRRTRKR